MNKKITIISILFIFSTLLFWWVHTILPASNIFSNWITTMEKLAKKPHHITLPQILMTSFWIVFITSISCMIAKKIALRSRCVQPIKNPLSETK